MGTTERHPRQVRVFCSYSHKDEKLLQRLQEHLAPLRRSGAILDWHDRKIGAGKEFAEEIAANLDTADIVLLLVSPSFLNSDFCWHEEMKKAIARHERGETRVIPIILRPCQWEETPFGKLLALPRDGQPVTQWADRDEALKDVAKAVAQAAAEIRAGFAAVPEDNRTLEARNQPRDVEPPKVAEESENVSVPELVVIPTGSFMMGSSEKQKEAYEDERPQHSVAITYRFGMGKYPVTFEQFDLFCRATAREVPNDEGWGRGRRPVINVSWYDAVAYTDWLTKMTGASYRLPTEAEWEYTCRAGTTSRFYCGETISEKHANIGDRNDRTKEVGLYPANPWGLYDMYGNVWEWVADVWHDSYSGAPQDGSAWLEGGDNTLRVVRGSSPGYGPKDSTSTVRCFLAAKSRDKLHGFRVARML